MSKVSQMCRKLLSLGEKSAVNKCSVSGKLGESIPKGSLQIVTMKQLNHEFSIIINLGILSHQSV